jgi:exoribonuclease-2
MTRPTTRADLKDIAHRAMIERGLLPDFSAAALAEVAALDRQVANTGSEVRDLRDRPWCSIDNESSRDLDQLSVSEPLSGDTTRILIAVADVDAMVPQGAAIDRHAHTNTTTVYTAAAVFSMLPERLSTDLTSLNPGQERLAIVVELEVRADGVVSACDIYRARVINHARLTYDAVAAWLDGGGPETAGVSAVAGLDLQLRTQDRVAQALKNRRHDRGALTLETTESSVVFDGDTLTDLKPDTKNRAKELIEDFMIAANSATAEYLERHGYASLRRVLRAPNRWERIVQVAASYGIVLPDQPDASALEQFLLSRRRSDPTHFPDLSLSIVKMLGSGEYVVERPGGSGEGHFGLAVRDYTHSTAPNRRFPDLATQRLLKAAMAGATPPYSDDDLAVLARHCTVQSNNASKVERQVRKSAAALLLDARIGERFKAVVTGASDKGTYVRIIRPAVEGRVVEGFKGLDVGDSVTVQLIRTDVARGFIDFRV